MRLSNKSSATSHHSAAPSGYNNKSPKSDALRSQARKRSGASAKNAGVPARSRHVTATPTEEEEESEEIEEEEEGESMSGEEGEEEGDEDEDEDEDGDEEGGGSEGGEEEDDGEEDVASLMVAPTPKSTKVHNGSVKMNKRTVGQKRPLLSQHRKVRTSFHCI